MNGLNLLSEEKMNAVTAEASRSENSVADISADVPTVR
jgi:hypothetical protein